MSELILQTSAVKRVTISKRAHSPAKTLAGTWGLRITALLYLALCALIPVVVIHVEGFRDGVQAFLDNIFRPTALNAITLTLWTGALMALINMIMGTLTAYVLTVYRFPGRALLNLVIDLPFAIPTLVSGVMLVLLYGPQTALGSFFEKQLGVKILFATPGIVIALLFVSFPFVVRAVQPAFAMLDADQRNAAYTLGASPWVTFWRVVFPAIRPAVISGGLLSFARALGEFGAVVLVAGNIPNRTQVASVYIYSQIESGTPQNAAGVSIILLLVAFGITLSVDWLQRRKHA